MRPLRQYARSLALSLALLLGWHANGQVGSPIGSTAFTRQLLTNATAAGVRTAIGLVSTNLTSVTNYNGDGSAITNLNANNLASGTVPNERFPSTLPAVSGANLTALNGSQVTSGTVPYAQLPSGVLSNSYAGTISANAFSGNGSALTGITATSTNPIASPALITSPATIYGVNGKTIGIQTNQGPAIDDYQGVMRFLPDPTSGFDWLGTDQTTVWLTLGKNLTDGTAEPIWRTYPLNALIETNISQGEALGAAVTSYSPMVGGNAAGMSGLPAHGPEIWNRLPIAPIQVISFNLNPPLTNNCNEGYLTNAINALRAANVIGIWTNNNIPVFIETEQWMARTRNNGHLQVNNQFPSGIGYLANYCITNGCKLELHIDYTAQPGTLRNGTGVFEQTAMNPYSLQTDINDFYTWGIGALRPGNGEAGDVQSVGFLHQMQRQIGDALLHPGGFLPGTKGYTNLIVFDPFILPDPASQDLLPSSPYEVNIFEDDQGRKGGPNLALDIGKCMYQARYTWTNFAKFSGKGHYFTEVYADDQPRNLTDLQGQLSMQLMFPGPITIWSNNVNTVFAGAVTNADWLALWTDPLQNPAFPAYDNGGNQDSIWVKPLVNGAYAVVFANETGSPLAMTLNWSAMKSPVGFVPVGTTSYPVKVDTNQTFATYDVWAGARGAQQQKSFVTTVSAHSVKLFRFDPVSLGNSSYDSSAAILYTTNEVRIYGSGAASAGLKVFSRDDGSAGTLLYGNAGVGHLYSLGTSDDAASWALTSPHNWTFPAQVTMGSIAGNPTTTTQTAGDNSTKLATTAYVDGGGGWVISQVTGSDATTTGQSLVDVTGLSFSAAANTTYEVEAVLQCTTSAVVTGTEYGIQHTGTGSPSCQAAVWGSLTTTTAATSIINALNTADATAFLTGSAQTGIILIKGIVVSGTGAGNITIRHLKVTSGTSTVKIGSVLKVRKLI